MKKLFMLVLSAVLMILISVSSAFAQTEKRVYDYAGILAQSDVAELENELAKASQEIGMDVTVLTSDFKNGKTLRAYADDFYDNGGFGVGEDKSGVVIFIDMEDRTVYMGTTGKAISYFTDARIYNMTDGDDTLYSQLAAGDYKTAVERCISRLVYYYNQGIEDGQHTVVETEITPRAKRITLFEFLIAVIIPGIIGVLVVRNIVNEYAMKQQKKQAENFKLAYQATCAFAFATAGDELINRSIARRVIPIVTSKGNGHGSHGQSTIHMGGSGTFHGGGGGGRHF